MREEAHKDTQGVKPETRLCSVVSKAAGDDPAGSGGPFDGFLAVEVPLPWRRDVTESVRVPERLRTAVEGAGIVDKFTGLVPDPEYSREGHARVLYWRRPDAGPFAAYERREYLVPEGELAALTEAMAEPGKTVGKGATWSRRAATAPWRGRPARSWASASRAGCSPPVALRD